VAENHKSKIVLSPSSIALLYVFISLVWCTVSSELVLREFKHPVAITIFEILKIVTFLSASGGLIFLICKRALERILREKERLRESEAERAELQMQLMQAQKLEGIGRLAGGVAHDFNNILTVILSSCHLLRRDVGPNGPQARLQMIETAADRAASLTRQLLAFSRHQVLEVQSVNLNAVIEETARLLERVLGEDVKLVLNLDPELGNVLADPGQMTQILMNLAINARDAMPKGGTIEIHTENLDVDEDLLATVPELTPGKKIMLSVRDTGEGIPAEIQSKIFEPFFTTKQAGKGTGLGLSTVYGIVQQSGGAIDLRSAPGRGTTFRIYLPRTDTPPVVTTTVAVAEVPGTETVLVVDDDELVLRAVSAYLRELGYHALTANGPHPALEISRAHDSRIDLLLTDLVMPDMTGPELRRQIENVRPLIRTVYMTGYASDRVPISEIDPKLLVRKPFTADHLAASLRRALQDKAPPG
jgi:two-component system, cell cycle sensor histidine kinase and response regulator CckA